jgi:HK97 family phage portal protein
MGIFNRTITGILKRLVDTDETELGVFNTIGGYRANDLMSKRSEAEILGYYRSWVKVAIDAIAEKIGEIQFELYNAKGDKIETHEILNTLNSPNEYFTKYTFFHRLIAYYLLSGEAPIFKQSGKKSKKLILLPPTGFKGVWKDNGTGLSHFELPLNGTAKRYEVEEIVPFFAFNPTDPMDGFSSTRANVYGIESMIEMENWQYQFYARGGIPPYAVIYDSKLTKPQVDKVKTRLLQEYSGSNNAFTPLVLSGGAKVETTGLTPKDIELTEQEKGIRDKILGQFRVPKAVVGAVDDVNRANAEASIYTFMLNTITPKMQLITDMLNKFWVSDWEGGLHLKFVNPVPQNRVEEAQVRKTRGAWVTINELRAEEGLPPVANGDVFIGVSPINLSVDTERKFRALSEKIERVKLASNITEKDDRQALLKMLDRSAKGYEARWVKSYRAYAKDLEQRLIKALKESKSMNITKVATDLMDSSKEVGAVIDILKLFYDDIGYEAILDAIAILDVDNLDPDTIARIVAEFYTPILEKTASIIVNTVRESIQNSLLTGLSEGEGIDDLAARIKEVANWMSTTQAQAIAETETTKITNGAFQITYEQTNAPYKEWVNLGDGRVRQAHQDDNISDANGGMIVSIDDSFLVGGEYLKYPGDPTGEPENVIRCRCRIIARWELPEKSVRSMTIEEHQKSCPHAK